MYHLQIQSSRLTIRSDGQGVLASIQTSEPDTSVDIFGVYGLVVFNNLQYLITVTKAKHIGDMVGQKVYEVAGVKIFCLTETENEASTVKILLTDFFRIPGLYFSKYKLSRRSEAKSTDFLFNEKLIQNYLKLFDGNDVPVLECIQGYFGRFKDLVLISRRSPARAGARYFSRGIDKSGYSSNFVETEQLILGKSSYVQIRGSIPLTWKHSVGYRYAPSLQIGNSDRFPLADQVLKKIYNKERIYLNLIHEIGYEEQLFKEFNRQLRLNHLTFYNYDFKKYASKMKFPFDFRSTGFAGKTQKQTKIIRTNCVDCLDRTNSMQYFIGRDILELQLKDAEIGDQQAYTEAFQKLFRENGNYISLQYGGTCALSSSAIGIKHTSIKEPIQDLYHSISRYFINRMHHGYVQDSYQIVTGQRTYGTVSSPPSLWLLALKTSALVALFIAIFISRFPFEKSYKVSRFLLVLSLIYLAIVLFPINYPSIK